MNLSAFAAESITDIAKEAQNHDKEYMRLKNCLPPGVDVEDAIEYGFYEYKNRYWIRRQSDMFVPVSNFSMRVLYLIVGANPKRIVEIKNVHGKSSTLDFAVEDLISLEKFKAKVESQGNYLFEGKPADLARIKNKLFCYEKPSIEIERLGQCKDKFFAFANGIFTGKEFLPVDDKGMVQVGTENYYIPVFGGKAEDDEDLGNYRNFVHRPGSATFAEWAPLFCRVYGDNGRVGLAFLIFALFSDIVFERTKASPMLFLFGQRGSGKGAMADSMLNLFGFPQDQIMLGGASTVVGFMRKMGQFSNALVWLDEYKNDIGERKIESLKNIWDRVGYERGVKDSSNRTQSTKVTSAAILSGQEMPNVEPALFSRVVLCEFRKMQHSQEDVEQFNALRRMEGAGITGVTLEILALRAKFKTEFWAHYDAIASSMRRGFGDQDITERQSNNYAILAAAVATVEAYLSLPFTASQLLQDMERQMIRQRDMMRTSNEVQQFFEMVAYLVSSKEIEDGKDIHVTKGQVKLRLVSILPLYREYSRRQGIRCLDKGTLVNYLQNSPAFCAIESKQSSHRFPALQNPTNALVFLQTEIGKLYGVDFSENTQDNESQQVEEKQPF